MTGWLKCSAKGALRTLLDYAQRCIPPDQGDVPPARVTTLLEWFHWRIQTTTTTGYSCPFSTLSHPKVQNCVRFRGALVPWLGRVGSSLSSLSSSPRPPAERCTTCKGWIKGSYISTPRSEVFVLDHTYLFSCCPNSEWK